MHKKGKFLPLMLHWSLLFLILWPNSPASAGPAVQITGDQPVINFPDTITFQAEIQGSANITSVVLEYGEQVETCGQVVAKAFPQFTPGTTVTVNWTWDMRQSGSLPPGATLWWRWRVTDESGQETVSDQKTVTWLDASHPWQKLTSGDIRLHWYSGDSAFAQDLLTTAVNGLARVEHDAGLSTDQPIDLYIYANTNDMKDAILYEPSWTGGEAFPTFNIVIIGISASQLSWGRRAEVHELTHVVVGHLTFSCLSDVPTWLNEGLAVYSEGALDPAAQAQLDQAIHDDSLMSVRSLSGGFSEIADQASLSYSESYSIVNYLVQADGRDKMAALLTDLRDGNAIDAALQQVYGFNVDGLEDAWRASIGAKPRQASPHPTAVPSPTLVPTFVPVAGIPLAITPTPFVVPTPTNAPAPSRPPLSLTLMLAFTACVILLVLAILVIGILAAATNRKGGKS